VGAQLLKLLQLVGVDTSQAVQLPPLQSSVVLSSLHVWLTAKWQGLPLNPRNAPAGLGLYCTYDRWFAAGTAARHGLRGCNGGGHRKVPLPEIVLNTAGINREHVGTCMRFRLGVHDLRVATGRWERPALPRAERVCQRCQQNVVEDEFHAVFECSRYRRLRQHRRFARLFDRFTAPAVQHPVFMVAFMSQPTAVVAAYLHACWLVRCVKREELECRDGELPDEFWSSIDAAGVKGY